MNPRLQLVTVTLTLLLGVVPLRADDANADEPQKPATAATPQPDGEAEADSGALFFKSLDRDGDGKLSFDEIPKQAQPRLKPLFDRIGKDSITAEELAELRKGDGNAAGSDRAKFFDLLDRNGDDKLTVAEVPARAKRLVAALLSRLDKAEDDSLTRTEYTALLAGTAGTTAPNEERTTPGLVKVLDTDGDGRLDKEELAKAADKFDTLDANGDGVLETSELLGVERKDGSAGGTRSSEYTERVFKSLDKDGDRKISIEEAPEIVREAFEQLDTDGNGLTLEEFTAAVRQRDGGTEEPQAETPDAPSSK